MKRYKLFVLSILLFLSGICLGTTYYIDPNGNDTTGDGSEGNPWATINKAIDTMADGDKVIAQVGTYTGILSITTDQNNKSLIIEGASRTSTIHNPPSHGINIDVDITNAKLTFRNMTISCSHANGFTVRYGTDDDGCDLTFENCDIYSSSGNTNYSVMRFYTDADRTAELVIKDCNIYPGTTGGEALYIDGAGKVEVSDCEFIGGYESAVRVGNAVETIDVHNNIVTPKSGVNSASLIYPVELTSVTYFYAYNNTCTNMAGGLQCPVKATIYVCDNNITIAQDSGVRAGYSFGSNNTTDESEAVSTLIDNVIIQNNKLEVTGADSAHAMLIGGNIVGAQVTNNWLKQSGDFGLVVKGKACHIANNILIGTKTLYLSGAQGCYVHNNTCYSTGHSAIAIGDNAGAGTARNPESNVIINNIFYAAPGCLHSLFMVFSTSTHYQLFDYNCYYGGDTSLIAYNGTGYVSLAALKAAETWEIAPGLEMDTHSLNAVDPLFVDGANDDFRLKPGSPCLNTGKPTLQNGKTSMGSWQKRQGTLVGDLNYDCKVDFFDFAMMAANCLIDCNLNDLEVISENWLVQ